MGHDATSSRVFDVLLQSPAVPHKEKRKFVMNFIGHYHTLVDDRIGSRVGDNCWAFADTYFKVCLLHLRAASLFLTNSYRKRSRDL